MARLAGFWKKIADGWTVQRIAAVLIVAGLVVFVAGVVNKHCTCASLPNLGDTLNDVISDFYANVSVDGLSIAFAILVIDRLNERRAEEQEKAKEQQIKDAAEVQLKEQLIRDMAHPTDSGIANHAVRELRAHKWLMDGSMMKANLRYANLEGSHIWKANLQRADLYKANLQGAVLHSSNLQEAILANTDLRSANLNRSNLQGATLVAANLEMAQLRSANLQEALLWVANIRGASLDEANLQDAEKLSELQLCTAYELRRATMCDGSRYDGRYNLAGDIDFAKSWDASLDDHKRMAAFYHVSLEDYLAGQEWARENLPRLRREAGLDPDTGEPVELTNGAEPQPAPRRNGHKASMVAHCTSR